MEAKTVIKIENLKKQYRLGVIGGGTLSADLQTWWARIRGKEDPNSKIGADQKRIGERFWALNGINLEVKKGEAVGIIGTNGAGKSTLLKILSQVTAPTEGDIWVNGRIASMLEVGTGFHPELTGRENIYMNGAILGMSKKEVDEKIEEIIEFSECRQFIDTPVKRYSSGMYVKLAFSVAAHLDADIMIMDEVLAVGDMKFQKKCLGKMGDAANNEGKTVLYVSHNMNTIRQLCTRCIVLKQGQVAFDGDVEEAIKVYLDIDENQLPNHYDFRSVKRVNTLYGKDFFIESLQFVNREKVIYDINEKIVFKIEWVLRKNLEDLHLLFSIKDADTMQTIGAALSETFIHRGNTARGETYFELELSNLVEGMYYFVMEVYTKNEWGTSVIYDQPAQRIFFQLVDKKTNHKRTWDKRSWGNVVFREIKVCNEEGT